jgi:hypothetical protein
VVFISRGKGERQGNRKRRKERAKKRIRKKGQNRKYSKRNDEGVLKWSFENQATDKNRHTVAAENKKYI